MCRHVVRSIETYTFLAKAYARSAICYAFTAYLLRLSYAMSPTSYAYPMPRPLPPTSALCHVLHLLRLSYATRSCPVFAIPCPLSTIPYPLSDTPPGTDGAYGGTRARATTEQERSTNFKMALSILDHVTEEDLVPNRSRAPITRRYLAMPRGTNGTVLRRIYTALLHSYSYRVCTARLHAHSTIACIHS